MLEIEMSLLFVVQKLIESVPGFLFADLEVFLHFGSLRGICWFFEKTKPVHEVLWRIRLNWKGNNLLNNIQLFCLILFVTL